MHRIQHLRLAPLVALVLSILLFESALAATPATQRQSAPTTLHIANTAKTLQREVFGFALASSLSDPTVGYPSWDLSLVSTVAFFGLHVNDNGTFAADSGMTVWNSSQLTSLLGAAHAHGTKVVVTVILQDFGAGTPHMCAGLANRATTVSQTVAQIAAKGVDGVNLDYEGLNGTCPNGQTARAMMTDLAHQMKVAMPAGSYLSVDTYASSAADPLGFFDVPGLNSYVDSFFVMAYDLEYSNYRHLPPGCVSFCLGPTSPHSGYYYNDATTADEYRNVVPASKVILGVPYYGRKACVAKTGPNAYVSGDVTADTYLDAVAEAGAPQVLANSYNAHRDPNDPVGQERWDTWWNTSLSCARELYWDDVTSLSAKYDLVSADNLRGVGIWTLNYGGGAPELWAALNTHFACPVTVTIAASQTTSEFSVGLSSGSCAATSFDVEQFDVTQGRGWYPLASAPATTNAGTAAVEGFPGYSYQIRARAHTASGLTGEWTIVTTSVAPTATSPRPFRGLYTLQAYGGIWADCSPPAVTAAFWPGWKIARAAATLPGSIPQAGVVLDGYGGVHWYGVPMPINAPASWPGFDIARDIAFLPDGSGGYVLDGYGGLHPFAVNGHALPPTVTGGPYWKGWDIARKLVIFSDGTGGLVMDGYGGLHPFGIGHPAPAVPTGGPYWPGWNIARDMVLIPGTHAGYVLDGLGGIHPFSGAPAINTPAYWKGWDIARALWLLPGSTLSAPGGYLLDGYGGLHPFGGAPALPRFAVFPGQDVAVELIGF
jgi:spore germination protein YaaH